MRLLKAYDCLLDGLAGFAGVLLFAIAAGISLDAVLRIFPAAPALEGSIELTEYALFAITFLAAPWALRHSAHISVEIAVDLLAPRGRAVVMRFVDVLGFVICAALTYAGAVAAWKAYAAGRLIIQTFTFPEWWLLALLPVGTVVLAIEFVVRIAGLRRQGPSDTSTGMDH